MSISLISVVVIGRNEGARLESCLRSILTMDCRGFDLELIYVDSGSSDDSVRIAQSLGAQTIALATSRPTAAQGRNAGWRAASGSIVLFLDGDTILHPSFVADTLRHFDDPSIAVVWGHRRETLATPSLFNRVLDLDWIYPPGFTPFCGGDALIRRTSLEATGGYDESLIAGEEPELCRRLLALNRRILHVDLPMTGHDLAITRWGSYCRRATRAGHAYAEVSARFAHTEDPFWLADSRRNIARASILLAAPGAALILSVVFKSCMPLALGLFCLSALVLRTAWKARWKSSDRLALLLYGIHSHLQQIPIFLGQVRFRNNRRSGRRAALVEYKQPEGL